MTQDKIEEKVAYLKGKMKKIGDSLDESDYYFDNDLEAIAKHGFTYVRYDFGIEMVRFTRIS